MELQQSNLEQITVEKALKWLDAHLRPCRARKIDGKFKFEPGINFIGGNGDGRRTIHEKYFTLLYPGAKQQVVFGTGKNGYEKYFAKRFIADFYFPLQRLIVEIDGESHKARHRKIMDEIRSKFFRLEHGIKVIRFSNKQIEKLFIEKLQEAESNGCLWDLVKCFIGNLPLDYENVD
jgi:hypothetical protein